MHRRISLRGLDMDGIDCDLVEAAHGRGMTVIPWTMDDKETMRHLIRLGVDGIITNYPDRLREVLAERSMVLPPQ